MVMFKETIDTLERPEGARALIMDRRIAVEGLEAAGQEANLYGLLLSHVTLRAHSGLETKRIGSLREGKSPRRCRPSHATAWA